MGIQARRCRCSGGAAGAAAGPKPLPRAGRRLACSRRHGATLAAAARPTVVEDGTPGIGCVQGRSAPCDGSCAVAATVCILCGAAALGAGAADAAAATSLLNRRRPRRRRLPGSRGPSHAPEGNGAPTAACRSGNAGRCLCHLPTAVAWAPAAGWAVLRRRRRRPTGCAYLGLSRRYWAWQLITAPDTLPPLALQVRRRATCEFCIGGCAA